jgi:uncharacterized membrane protein
MIRLEYVYVLIGVLLAAFAVAARRRPRAGQSGGVGQTAVVRHGMDAGFWIILAILFLGGSMIPAAVVGGAIVLLALLVVLGAVRPFSTVTSQADGGTGAAAGSGASSGSAAASPSAAASVGNALFVPVLLMPLLTVLGVLIAGPLQIGGRPLIEASGVTLVSLTVACAVALAVGLRLTRQTLMTAVGEGSRLLDAIGWAAVLPLFLAMLGGVFDASGVGTLVADLVKSAFPVEIRFVAVVTYGFGMALFTMIMGNAFAAFPVMTVGVGLPILVGVHHADPAPMCALGMLTGYCGTLLTPMAANFNLVPAALLELRDPNGVIKAQAPTGIVLFAVNIVLMNLLIFR